LETALFTTDRPTEVSPLLLKQVNTVVVAGKSHVDMLDKFALTVGQARPSLPTKELDCDEVLLWKLGPQTRRPFAVKVEVGNTLRRHQSRK
jgi:hypothetical protein